MIMNEAKDSKDTLRTHSIPMKSKIIILIGFIGVITFWSMTFKDNIDERNKSIQTLQIEKCKIVGTIDARHIFDDQKYRYQCESGMNYITSIRIDS